MIDLPPTHPWNLPDIQYPKLSHTFHFSKALFTRTSLKLSAGYKTAEALINVS